MRMTHIYLFFFLSSWEWHICPSKTTLCYFIMCLYSSVSLSSSKTMGYVVSKIISWALIQRANILV
jgi:hypothetical protein